MLNFSLTMFIFFCQLARLNNCLASLLSQLFQFHTGCSPSKGSFFWPQYITMSQILQENLSELLSTFFIAPGAIIWPLDRLWYTVSVTNILFMRFIGKPV